MKIKIYIGGIILFVVVIIFSFSYAFRVTVSTEEEEQNEKALRKAPDLVLQDYEGKSLSLSSFSGTPLVINSWAAWCPFCRKELPDFAQIQKEFKGRAVIVAIDRAESREIAKKYSDGLGVTDDLLFLLDPSDSFYRAIGGFSMPETIFVDRDGFIRGHRRGLMEKEEMHRRVQSLIQADS